MPYATATPAYHSVAALYRVSHPAGQDDTTHLGHLKETRDAYQRRVDDDLALFPSLAAPDPHGLHPIREWLSTHTGPLMDAGCTTKPSAY